jgi:hypothetical protein
MAAPAPGTVVLATATIDSLFTAMFATRTTDLGTPTYRWSDPFTVQAIFPAATSQSGVNGTIMTCTFGARAFVPSAISG